MTPLKSHQLLPFDATIAQLRNLWRRSPSHCIALYQRKIGHIIGILHPRDVLRAADHDRLNDYARPPWFVPAKTSLSHMIKQFRHNNQNIAIIIDSQGQAIGMISFAAIINEVFGLSHLPPRQIEQQEALLWEKTLPGSMSVGNFYRQFGTKLDENEELSLSDLLIKHCGHHPNAGDKIAVGPYEMTIKNCSLLEIKSLSVKGRSHH